MTQAIGGKIRPRLKGEFHLERFLPGLISGVLIGITEVIFALSVGSMIFSDKLSPYLSFQFFTFSIVLNDHSPRACSTISRMASMTNWG
jgi:hypothetical protein